MISRNNRRQHPRVPTSTIGYRPARASRFERVVDISAGGMRVLAPECLEAGERLPLELRMPDGASIELWAEVAWTDSRLGELPPGCECGLRFTDIPDHHRRRLASIRPMAAVN